jgi:hypothetical protein
MLAYFREDCGRKIVSGTAGKSSLVMLTVAVFAGLLGLGLYLRTLVREEKPRPAMTEDQIRQQWRQLGFFCELDDEKKTWTLTASRAGLLYFPDLLFGYVADPKNASAGHQEHYGPYGSLQVMTWPEAGFDGRVIRGSLMALTHLAELIEAKLATAEPGTPILIRDEFAPDCRYTLVLDVRADKFDPASPDPERLGHAPPAPPPVLGKSPAR